MQSEAESTEDARVLRVRRERLRNRNLAAGCYPSGFLAHEVMRFWNVYLFQSVGHATLNAIQFADKESKGIYAFSARAAFIADARKAMHAAVDEHFARSPAPPVEP